MDIEAFVTHFFCVLLGGMLGCAISAWLFMREERGGEQEGDGWTYR